MRIEAERDLVASAEDVWQLLAEPYHLSDWWPGYVAVRPDRRGLSDGARWTVVRSSDPGLLRKPGGEGVIVIGPINRGRSLAWRDLEQGFAAEIRLDRGAGGLSRARIQLDAPWWRIQVEGLRPLPSRALTRLHELCQTAASL